MFSSHERGPVVRCEKRQTETDDKEADSDGCMTGIACERDECEPQGKGSFSRGMLEQAEGGRNTRANTTAATKAMSAGMSKRTVPVPPSARSETTSASPRASTTATAAAAQIATMSAGTASVPGSARVAESAPRRARRTRRPRSSRPERSRLRRERIRREPSPPVRLRPLPEQLTRPPRSSRPRRRARRGKRPQPRRPRRSATAARPATSGAGAPCRRGDEAPRQRSSRTRAAARSLRPRGGAVADPRQRSRRLPSRAPQSVRGARTMRKPLSASSEPFPLDEGGSRSTKDGCGLTRSGRPSRTYDGLEHR